MTRLLPEHDQIAQSIVEPRNIDRAISELPEPVASLNRRYVEQVESRSLLIAERAESWIGQAVDVFLRHDRVRVFCVYDGRNFAMADYVTLNNVEFQVDQIGYQQTLVQQGPLPNRRTVHAYLHGDLVAVSDQPQLTPDGWIAVRYNPIKADYFFRADNQQPVFTASDVVMTPGRDKVWMRDTDTASETVSEDRS